MKKPYKREELFTYGNVKKYTPEHKEAAMLIGGIGTGSFSLGSRGQFKDWEIFNRPSKGTDFPYTFFAIHADNGKTKFTKVLESRLVPPFVGPQGLLSQSVAGLPRFESSEMQVRFPFVTVDLIDKRLPVEVSMEAYNPFIPLNADDSGIPAAIIRYKVKNIGDTSINVSVAGSLYNASGYDGTEMWGNFKNCSEPFNEFREENDIRGIYFDSKGLDKGDVRYGNLALMTLDKSISYKEEWNMGQRNDGIHDFWDDFCEDGLLSNERIQMGIESKLDKLVKIKIGSLAVYHTINPGETKCFEFALSWYFPNREKAWPGVQDICEEAKEKETIRNYYSTRFSDAWDAGKYLLTNKERLEKDTLLFTNAIYESTLPDYIIDAATANLTILKSNTCFRIENGHMFGFEGCLDNVGSCPGNCTHVWYYAQAMAYLFPELEQSMRETDFLVETDDDGLMQFRAMRELNGYSWGFIPAVDGQMGTIVRLYREWLISGDDEFLKRLWPKAVAALEYGIRNWDTDGDFVLDGMMHVDYDVEFYGPNPLGNFCYLAALKAAEKMAEHLGNLNAARRYSEIFSKASIRADKIMWNGEYFIQVLEDVNKYKYQHGTGCLADQLIGQFYAYLTGLGYLAEPEHIKKALESIYKYNFMDDFTDHHNVQRVYAINDDKGLLMATWPHGGRPKFPFLYSDEAWSRTEYHVAASLIYEGYIEEGLTVAKAVRDRYDGIKRNPWNEFECGYHYSGIMSSWGLLLALSGYRPDMAHKRMYFSPAINRDNFKCFWSNGKAWGTYTQSIVNGKLQYRIDVLYGELDEGTEIIVEGTQNM